MRTIPPTQSITCCHDIISVVNVGGVVVQWVGHETCNQQVTDSKPGLGMAV